MQDVEALRARPGARRQPAQRDRALDETRVLNSEGLRYDNEFVKHKVLDAIGDLYLLGHPLIGQYTAFKPGTRSTTRRARAARPAEAFEIATFVRTPTSRRRSRLGSRRRSTRRWYRPAAAVPGARHRRGRAAALRLLARPPLPALHLARDQVHDHRAGLRAAAVRGGAGLGRS
jgi:hypothetical protein